MSPNTYKKMLHKEVNKCYQKVQLNLENELNKEAEILATKLKVEGRIEKYNIKRCLSLLKTIKVTSWVTQIVD